MSQPQVCDVLVIGSGAGAGCVADVLTRAGKDVLMIEEGIDSATLPTPATAQSTLPALWRSSGLTMALGATNIAYAEGRCLGGGTQINSGIFQRTPDELLEIWSKTYKLAEFSANKLAPYYDRAAEMVGVTKAPDQLEKDSQILRHAGEARRWKVSTLDQAQLGMAGAPKHSLAHKPNEVFSTATAAIPAAQRRGMRVLTGCRAEKLEVVANRIIAVHAQVNGQPLIIKPRHVFLCAGAIHTAFLLRKSGLRTPQIGRSLQMHPTLKLLCFFDEAVDAQNSRLPRTAITEFVPRRRFGGSVFTPAFYGMALAENWAARGQHLGSMRNAAMYYAMIKPEGAGSIHAAPLLNDPIVRYSLAPRDLAAMTEAASNLAEALFAAGAKKIYPSLRGHEGWTSPSHAAQLGIRGIQKGEANLMSVHLFSSCPPGENTALCATNSFGGLRGVGNLTLADASQIPEAPGVNPQATVMAMALRNAEHFLTTRGA